VHIHTNSSGDWDIMILYDGQHVDGSPFRVRVYDPGQVKVAGLRGGVAGTTVLFTGKHFHIVEATAVSTCSQ